MVKASLLDDKIMLQRSDEDKKRFVHALNRIEGQVRGVRTMIEKDRYCGDELQQIKAVIASLGRVTRLLAEEHVSAAAQALAAGASPNLVAKDIASVVKRSL